MVTSDAIVSITQNVFSTMLQLEADLASSEAPERDDAKMIGCIQISGAWSGTVLLRMSDQFAATAASQMLKISVDGVELADKQDTLAELTNMIGGNLKSLLPGPSNLSLPTIACGVDLDVRAVGSTHINTTSIRCESHMLTIDVYEENFIR